METHKKQTNLITIPFLLAKESMKYADGNGLADIEEIDEEYRVPPETVLELVLDGLEEFDTSVSSRTKDWYGRSHTLEGSPIYLYVNYLADYVLKASLVVNDSEFESGIEDHESVLGGLMPDDPAYLRAAPNRLATAVWAVYEYWLFGERQLGLRTSERSIGVRAFSVFAASAFSRFKIDFGHWGDLHEDLESVLFNTNKTTESVFTYAEIGLLTGVKVQKGDLSQAIAPHRGRKFQSEEEAKRKDRSEKILARSFNTELKTKSNGELYIYHYPECEEYFQGFKNQQEKTAYLTHSEAVCFLRDHRSSKYKFTKFRTNN